MESVFEAFISNPALYSAGHLVGETLHFPTNTEEVQSLLKRIGVDGVRCQEYFIISFDSDILGLYDYLGEYENIDELNHLAHLLKELSPSERETLEAVMDSGQHCGSVQEFHFILDKQLQVCQSFHHRANLTRTFRTEYHPPTSGHLSRKSETVSCFSFVPNEVVNHHPIQSTTGRRKPLCPVPTMI